MIFRHLRWFPLLLLFGMLTVGCERPPAVRYSEDHDYGDLQRFLAISRELQEGHAEEAAAQLEDYVAEYEHSYFGHYLLGWAYTELDRVDEAEKCFQRALEINDEFSSAHVGLGKVARLRDNLDGAMQHYQKALEIDADDAEAYGSMVAVEVMRGDNQKAIEHGEKAWSLRQDDPLIAANLALAYHCTDNTEKRDFYFEHAKRLGYRNLDHLRDVFEGEVAFPPKSSGAGAHEHDHPQATEASAVDSTL